MKKRKNEIINSENIDIINEEIIENSDTEIIKEVQKPIISQEKCIVKTINSDTIGFYFKNYGISIKTNNRYNIGDEITVNYKRDIGKPDFEYWID